MARCLTPLDPSKPTVRATWTTTPLCELGACGFRIKSTKGSKTVFRFDEAIGDYAGRERIKQPCANLETGEVSAQHGYSVKRQASLQVVKGVSSGGHQFATEMFGDRREQAFATPAGEAAGCVDETYQDSMRVVRIDPPAGKPKPVTDGVGYGE